jgi:carbonic anhydrase
MKSSGKLVLATIVIAAIAGWVFADRTVTNTGSYADLLSGNTRYVEGRFLQKQSGAEFRKELAKGQKPEAVVVTCSDSRVSPEIIFDQDLGHIFVIRTAGNVVDSIAIGSIEYAVEHLHTPLIIVMGHESCGAVRAAIEHKGKPEGNIGEIIKKILPAVKQAKVSLKAGDDLAYSATIGNIRNVAKEITARSKIISREAAEGKVTIIGTYYSITSGKVETTQL